MRNFWSHLDLSFFAMFLFLGIVGWAGYLIFMNSNMFLCKMRNNNIARWVKAGVQKTCCEEPVNTLGFESHRIYVATTQLYHLV